MTESLRNEIASRRYVAIAAKEELGRNTQLLPAPALPGRIRTGDQWFISPEFSPLYYGKFLWLRPRTGLWVCATLLTACLEDGRFMSLYLARLASPIRVLSISSQVPTLVETTLLAHKTWKSSAMSEETKRELPEAVRKIVEAMVSQALARCDRLGITSPGFLSSHERGAESPIYRRSCRTP